MLEANEEENERYREFGDKINNLKDMLKNITSNPQVIPNY